MTSTLATSVRRADQLASSVFRNALLYRAELSAASALSDRPKLVVVFPWIGAKERIAHKFVESWTRRGFDVLHVNTPVIDLIRLKKGTEITAMRVADFLDRNISYDIILHGLSVGGYLSQRVLMAVQDSPVADKITHQIYDSFTHVNGFEGGVENAVHPRYKSIASAAVKLYLKFADLRCLHDTANFIVEKPSIAPALFIHSLSDPVAQFKNVSEMMPAMARSNPVYSLVLPEEERVGHVNLFRNMGEAAYMSAIIRFLRYHNFKALQPAILAEEPLNSDSARLNLSRTKKIEPLKS